MQKRSLVFILVLLMCPLLALAQQGTAELGGKVVDSGGGVLPGASLVITNEDTGVVRETTTTADGSYFVAQMIPGRYRVAVRMEGFKALDRRGVVLTVGQMTPLDLTMEVGALSETISVTGEAPLIDVTSSELGGHISAAELAELPAAARSYMAFVGSVPGAHFVPAAGFLNDTMLANGQPAAANNVSMDGATNIDDLRGSNVGGQARVANEALQEVQVITNQFDAEYGRASGAVINAVTKSGTNQFHGAAFGFLTGTKVTSRNYFTRVNNQPEPSTGKDEWGGTIGGPILRNKLFFFFTLERVTLARPQAATFPRPEFSYSKSTDESAWNTLWRIDHQVSKNNTWAFRWLREYAPQFDVIANQETLTSNDDETDLDETLVGTLTSVLSNTMVNTIRVGATLEETVHSNAIVRAQEGGKYGRCVPCPIAMIAGQNLLPPRLDYTSFDIQADDTMDFSIDDAYSIEDTFSWFVPNKAGRHDVKFGAKYTYVWISNPNNANSNGTYIFGHNLPFDRANPSTYPERLNIRVPGPLEYEMIGRTYELYAQDKWQIKPNFTLSLGLRYDLEVTPVNEKDNSLFSDASKYPVDKNNIAPRVGLVWNPDGQGKSVVRGGYGLFYDRTLLGTIDDLFFANKYSTSFTANFPQSGQADPGPGAGRFPNEPVLNITDPSQLTPAVRAIINATYPPGTLARNTGTVFWDDPDRKQPYFHQISAGYERELFANVSLAADYIRMKGKDMFLNPDLNIANRINTSRTGPIQRLDPFGVLSKTLLPGEPAYAGTVRLLQTNGYSDYDALNLSVEKRYSSNWSLRGAYSLGYSRGVVRGQADTPEFQVGNDLNLDSYFAPANVDRRHKGTISGRMEIPKTGGMSVSGNLRMMTGEPFTIHDTTFDLDRNGIGLDPLPAGTYQPLPAAGEHVMRDVKNEGGRNGAIGPGFMQLDMRVSYRLRLGGQRTFDIFGEVFNATDHANFTNPSADLRIAADFLRLRQLVATTGLPRQAQLGLRFGF